MRSLRTQVSLWIGTGLAVLLLGAAVGVHAAASRSVTAQFDATLRARMAVHLSLFDQEGDEAELDLVGLQLLESTEEGRHEVSQYWRPDGSILYRSATLGDVILERRHGNVGEPELWNAPLPDGAPGRWLGVFTSIAKVQPAAGQSQRPVPQRIVIVLGVDRTRLAATHRRLALGMIGGTSLLVFAVVGLVSFAVGRGLRPLDAFRVGVEQFDAETLDHQIDPSEQPTELRPIAESLNRLQERVDATIRRERRFTAAVAHEFRTPFAELRTLSEIARKETSDRDFIDASLTEIERTAVRMGRTLELLRTALSGLGELDEGALSDVDVADLLRGRLRALEFAAKKRGLTLTLHCPPQGATARTDDAALEAVIDNLLRNAIEYADPRSEVLCELEADELRVRLRLRNEASGLDPRLVDRIAEPFWRLDDARTPGERRGLGLFIATQLATLVDARLDLQIEDGSFVATLDLRHA